MNREIIQIIENLEIPFEKSALMAFIEVETGGEGFDKSTGKILIQFEPSWFRKKCSYAPSGAWRVNKVDVQSKEWIAFNNAYSINPTAAMESTSIGLGQIMGFHYKRLGYEDVNSMWEDAKSGLKSQVTQIVKFISSDTKLLKAIKEHNWHLCATYYNGSKYKELAKKYGRVPYNISLENAYNKYSKQ